METISVEFTLRCTKRATKRAKFTKTWHNLESLFMDVRPVEVQPVINSNEEEERKARREAVLQRQRDLQQKAQATPTPWENSLNRNATQPLPNSNGVNAPTAFAPVAQSYANTNPYAQPALSNPLQQQQQSYASPLFQQPQATPLLSPQPGPALVGTGREDFIRNAVEFLSDARVMASTAEKKTAFLRSKGLTQGEIDEAMRRTGSGRMGCI
jgi:hypothetical protein